MTQATEEVGVFVDAELYARVQQFYAWHMGLLDDGAPDDWADAFTADAAFGEPGQANSFIGREAIRASVRARADKLAEERVVIRHWFGMTTVDPEPDGALRVRNYALTLAVSPGGPPVVRGHAVCHDRLVPEGDSWLIASRTVQPDGSAR